MGAGHFEEPMDTRVAPLEAVLRANTAGRRTPRLPAGAAEEAMHRSLVAKLDDGAPTVLQAIVTAAVSWCKAGSAAISRLEARDGDVSFHWNPVAGRLAGLKHFVAPARFSPCQVCVDRREPVLYAFPERRFTYLQTLNVAFVELLVVPLWVAGEIAGTVWIAAHAVGRRFDAHDVVTASRLADLAGTALDRESR
jgi:hypothetical protein